MSIQRISPDIWGNWPPWTMEGEVVHGIQDNSKMLRALDQSISHQLSLVGACLKQDDVEAYSELYSSDISLAMADLSSSVAKAIHGSTADISAEIERLAEYLGCSLGFISDQIEVANSQLASANTQLEMLNWSATKLVGLGEQVLAVMREPLKNTARQRVEQGLLWFYQKEPELAEDQLLQSLQYDSTNYLAYYHLGHIYMSQAEWGKATRNFELAFKVARDQPSRVLSLSSWAKACYHQEQFRLAYELARRSVQEAPIKRASLWFECATYAARADDLPPEFGVPMWLACLRRAQTDPMYFRLATTHPDFKKDPEIKRVVYSMYKNYVSQCRALAEARAKAKAEARAKAETEAEAELANRRNEARVRAERDYATEITYESRTPAERAKRGWRRTQNEYAGSLRLAKKYHSALSKIASQKVTGWRALWTRFNRTHRDILAELDSLRYALNKLETVGLGSKPLGSDWTTEQIIISMQDIRKSKDEVDSFVANRLLPLGVRLQKLGYCWVTPTP